MKYWSLIALVLTVGMACREQLPDTPGLMRATQERNAGPQQTAVPGVSEAVLRKHLTGGKRVFADNFERESLGPNWIARSKGWKLVEGRVSNTDAKNKGLWLKQPLPPGNIRIEFDASSTPFETTKSNGETVTSFPGDIKCEAFSQTPNHQGGYIFIFGGWANRVNRIARIEEHGDGPGARVLDGPPHPVKPNHTYRMRVIRDGKTIAWFADEQLLVQMTDAEFINGKYFGFNNWEAHVTFDNIAVFSIDENTEAASTISRRVKPSTHKPKPKQVPGQSQPAGKLPKQP